MHTVCAIFIKPSGEAVGEMSLAVNWHDRESVRAFATKASHWLAKGQGYRVTTETISISTQQKTPAR